MNLSAYAYILVYRQVHAWFGVYLIEHFYFRFAYMEDNVPTLLFFGSSAIDPSLLAGTCLTGLSFLVDLGDGLGPSSGIQTKLRSSIMMDILSYSYHTRVVYLN